MATELPPTCPFAPSERVDLSKENIHEDLDVSQSYGGYLELAKVLGAQHPNSREHDEMLFIVVHQVSELWIRLLLHELAGVLACVKKDDLDSSFKMFGRIARIQVQLLAVWDVVATMTPADYSAFRNSLGRASGLQSIQYRLLEFRLGNKNADYLAVHQRDPAAIKLLQRTLAAPSLYDETLRLLSRRGYGVPDEYLVRDFSQPYRANKQVAGAWLGVYHNATRDWDLYELAECLIDVDHKFQSWRFQHMKTVERIIGYKRGTGGSSGVAFLKSALDHSFFPELWAVRTEL